MIILPRVHLDARITRQLPAWHCHTGLKTGKGESRALGSALGLGLQRARGNTREWEGTARGNRCGASRAAPCGIAAKGAGVGGEREKRRKEEGGSLRTTSCPCSHHGDTTCCTEVGPAGHGATRGGMPMEEGGGCGVTPRVQGPKKRLVATNEPFRGSPKPISPTYSPWVGSPSPKPPFWGRLEGAGGMKGILRPILMHGLLSGHPKPKSKASQCLTVSSGLHTLQGLK